MPLVSTRGAASAQGFGEFAQSAAPVYIEDVFQTWLYTGNDSSQTINNGVDLAGKGGLVWVKARNQTYSHILSDTSRGTGKFLSSNTTDAQGTDAQDVTAFNANGFTVGNNARINNSSFNYASWTFREQSKFFDVVTYTGDGTAPRDIAHNLGSSPGCVIIKRTSGTGNWWVWHRSIANKNIYLDATDAADSGANPMISGVSSTAFTLATNQNATMNASGATYVAYLFAHNAGGFGLTGTDNVISCGSFTTSAGGGDATVNLGYEPQWLLVKSASGTSGWDLIDNMRGMPNLGGFGSAVGLEANNANAEGSRNPNCFPTATGFYYARAASTTYIYIAIRRGPMKVPTTGTSVFSPNTTSGSAGTNITTDFPVDLQITRNGARSATTSNIAVDRLRGVSTTTTDGGAFLGTTSTNGESTAVAFTRNWGSTGFQVTTQNANVAQIYWNFRRAPGFFDEVCYSGSGTTTTQTHNLQAVPELIIVKRRSGTAFWQVYSATYGRNFYAFLNSTQGFASDPGNAWGTTDPTTTTFSLSPLTETNASGSTYVAYLFASVAGVSKVGSYTGTGTTQTINCGFTGGARFVMIKRADSTGDWFVWDTARGMIPANDPYLLLNSTAAEVTGTDFVDTAATGFEITSTAPAAINANGGTFIFLAIA